MTEHRQPKEYIITEHEVMSAENNLFSFRERKTDWASTIRSHPHTPAAPKPLRYSGVTVFTPPELTQHDATIRNQTLDNFDWGDIIRAIEKKGYTVKIRKQDAAIIRHQSTEARR